MTRAKASIDLWTVCERRRKDGSPRKCRFKRFVDQLSCIKCGRISSKDKPSEKGLSK